jgi:twinkle protein
MKTASEISAMLAAQAESVAAMLLPAGKRQGAEWCAGSTAGEAGSSLKVHLSGAKAGLWADFSADNSGDLLDLWMEVKGINFVSALKEAKAFLNVKDDRPDQFKKAAPKKYVRPTMDKIQPMESGGPVFEYLTKERRIAPHVLAAYQVGQTISSQHGPACVFPVFSPSPNPAVDLVKYTALKREEGGKKVIWASPDSKPHLFGWQAINDNTRKVFITEGEIDALTLAGWHMPALSVPSGVKNFDWIEHDYDTLARFERIYLVTDNDEPGIACAEEIAKRLGRERCFRVTITGHKDANEAAMSGKYGPREFALDVEDSRTLDPDNLRNASEYAADLWEENNPSAESIGSETPWGIEWRVRPGEVTIWTGWSGHGKSLLLNHVVLHDYAKTGSRVLIASLEMPVGQSMAQLARMAMGRNPQDRDATNAVAQYLGGGFWFYDVVGSALWREFMPIFAYAVRRYGIKRIVIDSLLRCGIAEDDYEGQKDFVSALVAFAAEHSIHIHLVAHSRKKDDETKAPGKLDIRGAAAITDLVHNGWSVWRNKARETKIQAAKQESVNGTVDPEVLNKPGARLTCWKNRKTGVEEYCNLWLIPSSQQFTDKRDPNSLCYFKA